MDVGIASKSTSLTTTLINFLILEHKFQSPVPVYSLHDNEILKISVLLMCIKSVFESISSIRHNEIVRKAIPRVYDTINLLKKFFRSSYLHINECRILSLSDCKYSLNPLSQTGRTISNSMNVQLSCTWRVW